MNFLSTIFITLIIATLAISSSAQVGFTEQIGGSKGLDFILPSTRFDVLSTERIEGVAINHSNRVEQILIEYSNGLDSLQVESVGSDAGDWSYFELEDGEFITYITGRAGTLIDQITFHTSLRRTFGPFGGSGGEAFEISVPSDAMVIGFTGKVSTSIQQLGLIYCRPQESITDRNRYRGRRYEEATQTVSSSEKTVRDHRTPSGATQTSSSSRETIRDHRQPSETTQRPFSNKRTVRDHRTSSGVTQTSSSSRETIRDHRQPEQTIQHPSSDKSSIRDHRTPSEATQTSSSNKSTIRDHRKPSDSRQTSSSNQRTVRDHRKKS